MASPVGKCLRAFRCVELILETWMTLTHRAAYALEWRPT